MTPTAAQTVRELIDLSTGALNELQRVNIITSGMPSVSHNLCTNLRAKIAAAEALLAREPTEEAKPLDRAFLQGAGDAIKAKLPDSYGFILLAFPFNGDGDERLVYCSNAQRADALNTVKEWLLKCGASEDWMKHIN